MSKMSYKQCKLLQDGNIQHAWIPVKGARVGASVEVPDLGGFWEVTDVYGCEIDGVVLKEKQRMNRNSLPSIAGDD